MQVVCAQCHAVCDVEPSGATQAVRRCASCGANLAPLPSASTHEVAWLVLLPTGQAGPYKAAEMAQLFDQASVDWTSLVWRQGLKGWRPARRDPVLVTSVASARGAGAFGDTQRVSPRSVRPPATDTIVEPPPTMMVSSQGSFAESWSEERGEASTQVVSRELAGQATLGDAFRSAPALMDTAARYATPNTQPVRQRRSSPNSWLPSAQSMLIVALVAFGFGVLAAALWGRLFHKPAQRASTVVVRPSAAPPAAMARPSDAPVSRAAAPSEPATSAESAPLVLPEPAQELPSDAQLRREVKRTSPDVRRCLDNLSRGVDVEVVFEGPTGRASDVRLRTSGLTPGRAECVTQVVRQMQVEPFRRPTYHYLHRFAY